MATNAGVALFFAGALVLAVFGQNRPVAAFALAVVGFGIAAVGMLYLLYRRLKYFTAELPGFDRIGRCLAQEHTLQDPG